VVNGTFIFLGILVIGMVGTLILTIAESKPYRRRGSARYPAAVYVPSDVTLPWGDPKAVILRDLPDGRGGTYSVPVRERYALSLGIRR
jgi:hypothetical protein